MGPGKEDLPDPRSALFKSLLQKDLVMNVRKDGKWGSMRHLPFYNGNYVVSLIDKPILVLFS
jgi:hypothetical protein